MSNLKPADTIGKYKVVELLGRGGMAEVWKGYQETLDRYVAIKVMHAFLASDSDFIGRFRREARAMAALNHPNIAGVYDFDVIDDSYYIVMEYVGGGTLKDRLEELANKNQMLPLAVSIRLVLEMAEALAYAHSRGMFHRDIKPANILLGDHGKAILTDFGIAKIVSGPSHTATGSMIGTPAYMSPEQGLGQPGDHRSDLYSLGVLFFQLVTGRIPYQATTPLAIVMKHVNEAIPDPSEMNRAVPAPIERVIRRAMAKEPESRYQSATEMARDLRRALAEVDDSGLIGAVPAELLRDKPAPTPIKLSDETPPPAGETVVSGTKAAGDPMATRVAGGTPAHDATRVATPVDATEVVGAPEAPPEEKRRGLSPLAIIGGVVLLLAIVGGIAGAFLLGSGNGDDPTPTQAAEATDPVPNGDGDESAIAAADGTPTEPPNFAATINSGLTATALANPTATGESTSTPTRTPSATPTASPTPDLTAQALAECTFAVSFVQHYTFSNRSFRNVQEGWGDFPLNLVLLNEGSCDVPAGATLSFVDGNDYETDHPLTIDEIIPVGDEVVITLDAVAPDNLGAFPSSWLLEGPEDAPFETPIDFTLSTFAAATPTPVASPTPLATPSPTPGDTEPLTLFLPPDYQNCEYVGGNGADYLCSAVLFIYGGSGPEYQVAVNTSPEQRGTTVNGRFAINVQGRRCQPWVQQVSIADGAGNTERVDVFFRPADYPELFPGGGCTEN